MFFRDERKDAKSHKDPPIKRLEFALEDQIYRIFRKARYRFFYMKFIVDLLYRISRFIMIKSFYLNFNTAFRIITNIAANSLFALPANHQFVYVDTGIYYFILLLFYDFFVKDKIIK